MDRPIVAFRLDEDGDWVAELSCGHAQHVRHRPPFWPRPWVLDDATRNANIGSILSCPLCDVDLDGAAHAPGCNRRA